MKNEIKTQKSVEKSTSTPRKNVDNFKNIEQALQKDEERIKQDEIDIAKDSQELKALISDIRKVSKVLMSTGFVEFATYLKSPWRIIWTNLLGGIFRGLGIVIGMTVVVALIVWLFSVFVDFPIIGEYFETAQVKVLEYAEQTNYKDEFIGIQTQLESLNQTLTRP